MPLMAVFKDDKFRLLFLIGLTVVTLLLHYYDILWQGLFGHSNLMFVIHSRLCYIPIVLAAVWFNLRGGILMSAIISAFTILYIFIYPNEGIHEEIREYTEIVFYFAIGGLTGFLVNRERYLTAIKEEAEKRLHRAEKLSLMGQMAASIAHEIKNPLGSIRGAAQILEDDTISKQERKEFADIVAHETDRLDGVVRQFLSQARIGPATISDIDICEVLSLAQKQLSIQAEKQNVQISVKYQTTPIIKGDKNRLHQVILNLILNAMQAMPEGGSIQLSCQTVHRQRREYVQIGVADTGPGIAPENLEKIFDPFFSTKSQGSGLGLATAREIIENHNGTIEAQSAPGKGTKFLIFLPTQY